MRATKHEIVGTPGVRESRSLVRSALGDGFGDRAEVAELLTSELVTNAIVHGRGAVELSILLEGGRLHVCVEDANESIPIVCRVGTDREHGRGMAIVNTLATSWGVAPRPAGGKTVWFDLDLTR